MYGNKGVLECPGSYKSIKVEAVYICEELNCRTGIEGYNPVSESWPAQRPAFEARSHELNQQEQQKEVYLYYVLVVIALGLGLPLYLVAAYPRII